MAPASIGAAIRHNAVVIVCYERSRGELDTLVVDNGLELWGHALDVGQKKNRLELRVTLKERPSHCGACLVEPFALRQEVPPPDVSTQVAPAE